MMRWFLGKAASRYLPPDFHDNNYMIFFLKIREEFPALAISDLQCLLVTELRGVMFSFSQ